MDASKKPESVQDNPEAHVPPSPATDPTNPYHAEAAGEFVAGERNIERRDSGPGVTDRERQGATGGR